MTDGPADGTADNAHWSSLHSGVQPSLLVRGWLRMIWALTRGPVLRIPPDVLSLLGLLALVGAWAAAVAGWPVLTAVLVVASGFFDGLLSLIHI